MVWTMSADNEKTVGAVVGEESVIIRKAKTKKYLIIGVSSVIVAVLILIGILVGIYLFTETFNKIVTQNLKTKNSDQDVSVDLTANIIQYDVKAKDNVATYVDDYNSFLRVAKVTVGNEIVCYADFMNGTDKVDLTKVIKTTDMIESNNKVYYERVGSPIPDNSFMNTKARKLCKGISTYWIKESCNRQLENQKQKRATCCRWYYRDGILYSGGKYYYVQEYVCFYYNC